MLCLFSTIAFLWLDSHCAFGQWGSENTHRWCIFLRACIAGHELFLLDSFFFFLLPSTWGLLLSWAKALGSSGLANDLAEESLCPPSRVWSSSCSVPEERALCWTSILGWPCSATPLLQLLESTAKWLLFSLTPGLRQWGKSRKRVGMLL